MPHPAPIDGIQIAAFTIPTSSPEADGTYEWTQTTMVVVHLNAAGRIGLGYTYGDVAVAALIEHSLAQHVLGADCMSPRLIYDTMLRTVRNLGHPGVAAMAISAVDVAVHDLKARLLDVPVVSLLGQVRPAISAYGSGGFTSYDDAQLTDQFRCWAGQGFRAVKMKIGTHPDQDLHRVQTARRAIGDTTALYVDANGAFDRKQALHFAEAFVDYGVSWFEEPVTSDDLTGLRMICERAPAGMDIAAGEYGYTPLYFRRMLESNAVDVIQIDSTRCGGVTGFVLASAVAEVFQRPISAHTAPSLHGHLCCAQPRARNVEYFHDHVRIEAMLLDGALVAKDGMLQPNLSVAGFGLALKAADAAPYRVYAGEQGRKFHS
jgi:L-alanine-DL-glutamate epimerase-like enolase superfamily enzyme